MPTAWFLNIPTHGHVNPTLPLVRELVRQGDAVTYFAGPAFAERIRATGAAYGDYGDAFAFEASRAEAHAILHAAQLAEATGALLPRMIAAFERERPDYLLFDMSAPWASILARRYGVPAVACFPHLPFQWRAFAGERRLLTKGLASIRPGRGHYRRLLRQLLRLAREQGLGPTELNLLSSKAGLNLVFSSRYFQPQAERMDASYVFIGPMIHADRPDEPGSFQREAGRKLIYIAVGTLYRADLAFFRHCMQAFAGDWCRVLLSVGRAVDLEELGPVPDNFNVAQYLPQLAILDEADLFITHGGLNSINEAVMAGVPMIVVPNTVEQAANGVRVEQLGAGRYLDPGSVDAEALRAAAQAVLGDPELPAGVERLRQSFLAAGGVARGVEAIRDFVGSGTEAA